MVNRLPLGAAFSILTLAAAALGGSCLTATAGNAFESVYTSIAEAHCRKTQVLRIADTEYAVSRICPGRAGYQIFINEEDLRETLTVGETIKQAAHEPAAHDHFGAFNSYGDTVEWRHGRGGTPFAIIVGWSFADNENTDAAGRPKSARLLIVMRLPPGPVCKVAYIDRAANPDANALARKAADEMASGFKCGSDEPQIIGQRGRAIEVLPSHRGDEEAPNP
jgi:hypothetical protein